MKAGAKREFSTSQVRRSKPLTYLPLVLQWRRALSIASLVPIYIVLRPTNTAIDGFKTLARSSGMPIGPPLFRVCPPGLIFARHDCTTSSVPLISHARQSKRRGSSIPSGKRRLNHDMAKTIAKRRLDCRAPRSFIDMASLLHTRRANGRRTPHHCIAENHNKSGQGAGLIPPVAVWFTPFHSVV